MRPNSAGRAEPRIAGVHSAGGTFAAGKPEMHEPSRKLARTEDEPDLAESRSPTPQEPHDIQISVRKSARPPGVRDRDEARARTHISRDLHDDRARAASADDLHLVAYTASAAAERRATRASDDSVPVLAVATRDEVDTDLPAAPAFHALVVRPAPNDRARFPEPPQRRVPWFPDPDIPSARFPRSTRTHPAAPRRIISSSWLRA